MDHRDAELTEVIVVLEELDDDRTCKVVELLQVCGLEVAKVDNDQSIVHGTILAGKVGELKTIECVRFVRSVLTYTVDYPPGDPRDLDGPDEDA
jgi:hypothetical protein